MTLTRVCRIVSFTLHYRVPFHYRCHFPKSHLWWVEFETADRRIWTNVTAHISLHLQDVCQSLIRLWASKKTVINLLFPFTHVTLTCCHFTSQWLVFVCLKNCRFHLLCPVVSSFKEHFSPGWTTAVFQLLFCGVKKSCRQKSYHSSSSKV